MFEKVQQVYPAAHLRLGEDVRHMVVHRVGTDAEFECDLLVGHAIAHQLDHGKLPLSDMIGGEVGERKVFLAYHPFLEQPDKLHEEKRHDGNGKSKEIHPIHQRLYGTWLHNRYIGLR